jgi:hypothetical protein
MGLESASAELSENRVIGNHGIEVADIPTF